MSTNNVPLAREPRRGTRPAPAHLPAGNQQATPSESEAPCSSLLTGNSAPTCAGIRNSGQRCRGRRSAGHAFCSFHRLDLQGTIRDGRVEGGRRRHYEFSELEEHNASQVALRLDSRGGVQGAIDSVLRQLFLGRVSPAYVSATARLFNVALRNLDHTDRESEDHSLGEYIPSIANLARLREQLERSPSGAQLPGQQGDPLQAAAVAEILRLLLDDDPEPAPTDTPRTASASDRPTSPPDRRPPRAVKPSAQLRSHATTPLSRDAGAG